MTLALVTVLLAGLVLLALAVVMGSVLGIANKAFHVPVDLRQAKIDDALPGANCGGCGYIGCSDYAEAVVRGEAVDKCPVGGSDCTQALAAIMGVEIKDSWPVRPVVHCSATYAERLGRGDYHGERSCHAANVIGGVQGCTYGCLGFGDCVVACDYDAIHVIDGLARVDYDKCVGCGACVRACPRNIISQVPFKADRILAVLCCNQDFGKDVMLVCTVGCTGCSGCARNADLINMDGKVPVIDYENYDPLTAIESFAKAEEKCPRESLVWIGKPSADDLVAAAKEDLAEVVTADFETTADKADWRG